MAFSDSYAWAGTALLLLELFHFGMQRKLYDQRTRLFILLLCTSLLICISSIVLTRRILAGCVAEPLAQVMAAVTYFAQLAMPYLLFRMNFQFARKSSHFSIRVAAALFAGSSLAALSNPWTGIISYPGQDGLLHVGKGYSFFVWGLIAFYLADVGSLVLLRGSVKQRHRIALTEVYLVLIGGMLIQNVFRIRLVVGFAAALAMAVLYVTVQSPYAYIDFTTHVFNADYFNYWIWERFSVGKPTFLLVVRLSALERIRTIYGTDSELSQQVAKKLWEISEGHQVFRVRYGKYAVFSDTAEEHQQVLQRVTELFSREIELPGRTLYCPAVLVDIEHTETVCHGSIPEMMCYVRFLLSQASNQNTLQIVHDTQQQRDRFRYEQTIQQYLNQAIEQDLFEVWYQPIWSVSEQKFVGLEALSRLYHPKLGWINPELFIRLAVKNGQIFTLMPQQLHKVCRFLQEHPTELNDIRDVKINLSPAELTKKGYCAQLIDIIRSYGLSPEKFQFEVTETDATEYTREVERCIQVLQQAGIRLCLDDFGSGYANLSRILRLPFHVIKMDRSLLQGICESKKSAAIYHSVVDTLHNIGYQIVSEGVETAQEADLLAQWNVDMIQGYYYAKPQPENKVLRICNKPNT